MCDTLMLIMPCLERFEENDAKKRARLLASLCQSFPSSALSKALCISCDENVDPLGFSCLADVCAEKFRSKEADDLTSLAWLQDANLLKNIIWDDRRASPQPKSDPSNDDMNLLNAPCDGPALLLGKHKPPYSFSCLIFMAIEASPTKCLPVRGIYDWIVQTFPYFHSASRGWRNSVRHNLSLNKCFKKIDRSYHLNLGKGSSWCVDPVHRPNLQQALRRTPYHPFHQRQMVSSIIETTHRADAVRSSNETKDQERFSSSGTNGGYTVKQQSNFAGVGRTREKNIDDQRFCTAYPNDDHIYSIPRTAADNASADENLYSRSESEKETGIVKSESHVNLTNESKNCCTSRPESHATEIVSCRQDKAVVSHASKQSLYVDSDENDEMKTLYFTSLALLELAAGAPPNSRGNKVRERNPESKYDSRAASQTVSQTRVRISRRSVKSPVVIRKNIPNRDDELSITSRKVGKRRQKQPVPVNGSRWQKKRRLRGDDKNHQILPSKTSIKKREKILHCQRKR